MFSFYTCCNCVSQDKNLTALVSAMGWGEMGRLTMGRGERGMRWGWGGGEEEERGGEISQMDMMGCLGGHGL